MRLLMFILLITFFKASHSFRNRLLVICKNAYLFATMIMTSVSHSFPTRRSSDLRIRRIAFEQFVGCAYQRHLIHKRQDEDRPTVRSEEHTSELQSRQYFVCRLLLENNLLVICKNAYLFATMIMTSVSSPFSCCSG